MGRKLEYGLLVILSIVFLAAGGYVFQIWAEYHGAASEYQDLEKYKIEEIDYGEAEQDKRETEDLKANGKDAVQIDFDGLRAINEDIVAWIQIPGIGADYPVVQGEDNEHYLHYTFEGKENMAGSIFLDYRNRADFMDSKVILYGHNMKDGSMFSKLEKYQEAGFRKEQGRVMLYLPDKTLECEITECRQVSIWDSVYDIKTEKESETRKEMVLSTCGSSSYIRLILKCVVKGESIL